MLARFINNLIFLLLCLASFERRGKIINEIIERVQTFNNLIKGLVYFEALFTSNNKAIMYILIVKSQH